LRPPLFFSFEATGKELKVQAGQARRHPHGAAAEATGKELKVKSSTSRWKALAGAARSNWERIESTRISSISTSLMFRPRKQLGKN
jgi:hypothetical protein